MASMHSDFSQGWQIEAYSIDQTIVGKLGYPIKKQQKEENQSKTWA